MSGKLKAESVKLDERMNRVLEGKSFNVNNYSSNPLTNYTSKLAFTLAEVLITLGIIGVVSAITMPTLIQNHRKTVVETSLKKFYSNINQAILLAESRNGNKIDWKAEDIDEFWDTYLKPYLKYVKVEDVEPGESLTRKNKLIYFADGSAVLLDIYYTVDEDGNKTKTYMGGHAEFCPEAKYCKGEYIQENWANDLGKRVFRFGFFPNETASYFKYHYGKGYEPYVANWNGTENNLLENSSFGCRDGKYRVFCTAVIQHNGWKIPKDYPIRF